MKGMTGKECLIEKLIEMGHSKAQANSKVVDGVIAIITQTPDIVDYENVKIELAKAQGNLTEYQHGLYNLKANFDKVRAEYQVVSNDLREAQEELQELTKHKGIAEYINDFLADIEKCETSAGRDAMKAAQVFVNTVTVDTKYDNTAFIAALGAILSQGAFDSIDHLRKINPKMAENRNSRSR